MKYLVGVLILIISVIAGLSVYLTPVDLVKCETPTESGECKKADYIIVVSGGDTQARTAHAIDLYKEGWSDRIIFSGAAQDKSGPSNAAVMKEQALEAGVPEDSITIEENSESTKENSEEVTSLVYNQGVERIILVTSAYHQRRVYLEFSQKLQGKDVEIKNSPVLKDKQWSIFWWLTPQGWWLAGGEFLKIIGFYMGESR